MAVGCGAVACERRDARQRARLRSYVAVGEGPFHALLQSTVDPSDGEGGVELSEDILVVIGKAQEAHQELG